MGPDGKIWFLKYTTNTGVMQWSTRFTLTGTSGKPALINNVPFTGQNLNASAPLVNTTTGLPGLNQTGNGMIPPGNTSPNSNLSATNISLNVSTNVSQASQLSMREGSVVALAGAIAVAVLA